MKSIVNEEYSQGSLSESADIKVRRRPKQRREATSKDRKDSNVFALIENWSAVDQLFNCKYPKYHLRYEKLKSLEKIRIMLLEKDTDVAVKQITDKMLSLRNYFSAER